MEVRAYDMADVEFAFRLLSEGLSTERAAERTGFSKSSISRWAMASEGLVARRRSRLRWGSYSGEASPAPPNLPLGEDGAHDFGACAPNRLWVTDITELGLPGGRKPCPGPVVDCFDGRPVSWSAGARPTAELASAGPRAACATLPEGERPVIHSDRGGHYRWPGRVSICERSGPVWSMPGKPGSPDDARKEGFFGTLKQEFFYSSDWAGVELSDLVAAPGSWMRWFCSGRMKEGSGWPARTSTGGHWVTLCSCLVRKMSAHPSQYQ